MSSLTSRGLKGVINGGNLANAWHNENQPTLRKRVRFVLLCFFLAAIMSLSLFSCIVEFGILVATIITSTFQLMLEFEKGATLVSQALKEQAYTHLSVSKHG